MSVNNQKWVSDVITSDEIQKWKQGNIVMLGGLLN